MNEDQSKLRPACVTCTHWRPDIPPGSLLGYAIWGLCTVELGPDLTMAERRTTDLTVCSAYQGKPGPE